MTSHGLTAAYTNLTDFNIDFKIINRAGKSIKSGGKTINRAGKLNSINYPPPPVEFTDSKSGRKTPSTTPPPPRIHETHRLPPPPRNRAENFSHGFRFSKLDKYASLHFVGGNGPTKEYPDPIPAVGDTVDMHGALY